jgi:hypothetical protein
MHLITIPLRNHRTASVRLSNHWQLAWGVFRTCRILQVGPLWISVDRKRNNTNQ